MEFFRAVHDGSQSDRLLHVSRVQGMSQIVEELLEEHDRLAAQLTEERASNASHVAALQSSIAKLEASGAQKDFQIAQLDAFCQRCTCQPDVKVCHK